MLGFSETHLKEVNGLCLITFSDEKEKRFLPSLVLFFFFFKKFIYYLFLAVLGLCCCTRAFSSCGKWGLLFVAVRGLPIAEASLVVQHWL